MNIAGFVIANHPNTRRNKYKSVLPGPLPSAVQASLIGSPDKSAARGAQSGRVENLASRLDAVSDPMRQIGIRNHLGFVFGGIATAFRRAVALLHRQGNAVVHDRHDAQDALRTSWQLDYERRRAACQISWCKEQAKQNAFFPTPRRCEASYRRLERLTFGHDVDGTDVCASPEGWMLENSRS